jgi:hypothetical protein
MNEISMRMLCETLYCAYVPSDAFAVGSDDRIAFVARVTEAGQTAEHHVEFNGVHDLVRRHGLAAASEPGDQLELSVIETEHGPSDWRVWLNPWYLEEVEFRCARILLDGAEVVGEGRWLQDELPTRSAG